MFLEKINKLDKPLGRVIKKKREKKKQYWYEKWNRGEHYWCHRYKKDNKYYKQLYTSIFDKLDETNQYFERSKLLRHTQYKINDLNRTIHMEEIE